MTISRSIVRSAASIITIATSIDGLMYVPSAKEVWVTTPKDSSLTILDASKPALLKQKLTVKVPGQPEGFAVDDAHDAFITNLEDKGSTLVIGIEDHKIRSTWNAGCSTDGPRGVAVDSARGFLFVACTDHVQVLDSAHDGALLGKIDTGAGVDNIDYLPAAGELVVGAGKAAKMTVSRIDEHGVGTLVASGATAQGSRNAVVDANEVGYVPDPANGALLVLSRN
jgi:DNA-binding beta-propeller fold protein YncE